MKCCVNETNYLAGVEDDIPSELDTDLAHVMPFGLIWAFLSELRRCLKRHYLGDNTGFANGFLSRKASNNAMILKASVK